MNEKEGKSCYIYRRVSTNMQVDGYSLDAQKDRLIKYAEYERMKIVVNIVMRVNRERV